MLWYERLLRAAEGGGGGATGDGSGGGDGASGEPGGSSGSSGSDTSTPPAWAVELNRTTNAMAQAMAEIVKMGRQTQTTPQTPDDDDDDDAPQDLELLSRNDFARHIVAQVEKTVNKNVVEPLTQQLQELRASTTRGELVGAVKELRAAHKDFDDWRDEMIGLAKEHPGLPPNRLYKLARAEFPKKAETLDKKYNPPQSTGLAKISFGGLTPSQSGTGSRARNMKGPEAAEAAWQDVAAALGAEPDFSE